MARFRKDGDVASDWALAIAAAVGLFVSLYAWFNWHSGIHGEPGTMLVIAACALILVGLVVTLKTHLRGLRRLFNVLVMLATVLTAIAGWFLMLWPLVGAMIVAAIAQILRMMQANMYARIGS